MRVAHQWPIVAVAATVRADGGTIAEARVGLTNMGSTPLRARGRRGGPGRAAGHRRRRPRGGRAGGRGHQPAVGPQRRRRLPAAPGRRAHPPRGARRRGSLIAGWISHTGSPSPPRSRRPGRTSRTSRPSRSASPEPRSPRPRGTRSAGSVKVKLGPIALVYNGSGTFVEKDETAHRFVVDAKGKDKRGNGTAGAKVTLSMALGGVRGHRRRGAHRPGGHRQAGAVRPRRHAGRLGQAARPVRGLPGAAARRRRRDSP